MSSLSNKVIVVTGAAGRLGRRIVQRFAGEGAAIAAVVRTEEDAQNLPFPDDGEGWAFPVDLADEELVRACFDQIEARFSRVDALVHTVGMWESSSLAETTLAQWEKMMQVNLTSAFLCFREAVRVMDGPGQLVAFASRQGADGGVAGQAGYSASKAGLLRLVEAVSGEYRERGITAHSIVPSVIRYDEDDAGVAVEDVVEICRSLITGTGAALNGATIRAYGTG